jgi:hypothetical protein
MSGVPPGQDSRAPKRKNGAEFTEGTEKSDPGPTCNTGTWGTPLYVGG